MDFNYTFHYRLSYQEAYDTFYLLATRLTRKKKIIYGILLTAIAVLSLVFYGLDTRKVHLCLLAIFAAVLLFYLLYYPVFSARKGAAKVVKLNGNYQFTVNQLGQITLPQSRDTQTGHCIVTLGEDKHSRVLETDTIYAIRADAQTTLCLPKRILKNGQKENLDQMFHKLLH